MNKKKYLGGLKLSLLLLFIILLGSFSTCYANVSEDYVYYLLESCAEYSVITSTNQAQVNNLKNFYKTPANVTATTNYINYQLNYNNLGNFNNYNLIALLNDTGSSSYIQIFFIFSNCGLNDVYNSGYLRHYPTYFNVMNTANVPVGRTAQIYLRLTNTGYNFTQYFPTGTTSYNFNGQGYTIDGSIINVKNCFNYVPTQTVYDSSDVTKPLLLTDERGTFANNRPIEPEPEEPSGDTPIDSGLGNITNSSGESGGNINLQPIQEGLTNIQNQISGDTQKIINNQNTIAEQQHEDLTSYDTELADEGVNDLIDNIQNTLSGDLSNSEIFGALEEAESGFFDIITGEASDFIISWNDIRLDSVHDNNNQVLNHASGSNFSSLNGAITLNTSSNGVIIPAGFINFSKACRENATLGNIKEKINIILSALCGLALIKYLYNLLLATLGIDNPYLYEKTTDNHINSPTVRDATKIPYTVHDKNGNLVGWGRDEK